MTENLKIYLNNKLFIFKLKLFIRTSSCLNIIILKMTKKNIFNDMSGIKETNLNISFKEWLDVTIFLKNGQF